MAVVQVSPNVRKRPPRPPPPRNLPDYYQFCKLEPSFSPTKSPEKKLASVTSPVKRDSSSPASPAPPFSLRKGSAPVVAMPPARPPPVPLPRQRRYKSDAGVVVSAGPAVAAPPVAKPRQHPVPKARVTTSPSVPPRPQARTTPPKPKTSTCTRAQPVARRAHTSHSLSASLPPEQPATETQTQQNGHLPVIASFPDLSHAKSMPRLGITNSSPVQSKRRQPPRPSVGPRLSHGVSGSLRPAEPTPHSYNTLPKPSKINNDQHISLNHQERERPASDCIEDNIYTAIADASSMDSDEDLHSAPLYAIPDETGIYAGLIEATKEQGDGDYVALGRIPSDQQPEAEEAEEGNELYTIPDNNSMYMSIDRHTMQVDMPYEKPTLSVDSTSH